MGSPTIVQKGTQSYYTNYVRNIRAVGVMWAVFVICLAIINVVVVAQPQWVGDTSDSPGVGFFGVVSSCQLYQSGQSLVCQGRYDDFPSMMNDSMRAAAVFAGFAAILTLLCIVLMLLFFFVSSTAFVFTLCGSILAATSVCSALACIIFPSSWDHERVLSVCGSSAGKFSPGTCSIRWAYVLAIISIFDALVLALLAFVLASRLAKLTPQQDQNGVGRSQSEVNSAYLDDGDTMRRSHFSYQDGVDGMDAFTDASRNSRAKSARSKNFHL